LLVPALCFYRTILHILLLFSLSMLVDPIKITRSFASIFNTLPLIYSLALHATVISVDFT